MSPPKLGNLETKLEAVLARRQVTKASASSQPKAKKKKKVQVPVRVQVPTSTPCTNEAQVPVRVQVPTSSPYCNSPDDSDLGSPLSNVESLETSRMSPSMLVQKASAPTTDLEKPIPDMNKRILSVADKSKGNPNFDRGSFTGCQNKIIDDEMSYDYDFASSNLRGTFNVERQKLNKTRPALSVNTPSPNVEDRISGQSASSAHLKQLFEQNECMKRMLRQVLTNQRRILSFVVPEEEVTANDFENLPDVPLVSEEKFEAFEEYLSLKTQRREVKHMTSLYKENWDEQKFVGHVLRNLITNDLARIISWEGTDGTKIPFRPSRLNHTIRLAVLKKFSSQDLQAAETRMKRWFSTSEQRKHD
ncbi:Arginine--tRNA ligase [Frankliniella fusca]|uniref:Arginine--tRNA ligase n=1 Tax=Frankliniella fusca TaxID=407009 RepID=A0AAE1HI79_9NEOP|nr:Arginine--tRNA ligase [Frankliniella fusca]